MKTMKLFCLLAFMLGAVLGFSGCVTNGTNSETNPVLGADDNPVLAPTRVASRIAITRPALGPDGTVLLGPAGEVLLEKRIEMPVPDGNGNFLLLPTEWVRGIQIRAFQKAKWGGEITDADTDVLIQGKGVNFATGAAATGIATPETVSSLIDGIVSGIATFYLPGLNLGGASGVLSPDQIQAYLAGLTDEERQALIESILARGN